jgi:hypothetical protein
MHLHAMGNNCHARMKFELQDVEVPRGINSESCSAATCGKAVLVMEKPDTQQAVPQAVCQQKKSFYRFMRVRLLLRSAGPMPKPWHTLFSAL